MPLSVQCTLHCHHLCIHVHCTSMIITQSIAVLLVVSAAVICSAWSSNSNAISHTNRICIHNVISSIVLARFNEFWRDPSMVYTDINRWLSETLRYPFDLKIRNTFTRTSKHAWMHVRKHTASTYLYISLKMMWNPNHPFYGNWSELSCKLSLINQMPCVNKFNWNWSKNEKNKCI